MSAPISRTLRHWRLDPSVDVFDIRTAAEAGNVHCHPTWNFGCVLGGQAQFDVDADHWQADPDGTVVLLNAFQAHASAWLAPDNRYFVIYVGPEAWAEITAMNGVDQTIRFAEPVVRDNILHFAMRGLWAELNARPEGIDLSDIAALLGLCIGRGQTELPDSAQQGATDRSLIDSLAPQASLATGGGTTRVEDVAASLGMSRFQFSRLCNASLGMQPRRLKIQLMVALAQSEIARGASLTDAAILAGFSDQSHMTREFRRTIGMTPREYRDL